MFSKLVAEKGFYMKEVFPVSNLGSIRIISVIVIVSILPVRSYYCVSYK